MDVNPGALVLLVVGFVAVVVGMRGTQGAVGSLLTGRASESATALGNSIGAAAGALGVKGTPAPAKPQPTPKYSVPAPTGVHAGPITIPPGTPLPGLGPIGAQGPS